MTYLLLLIYLFINFLFYKKLKKKHTAVTTNLRLVELTNTTK